MRNIVFENALNDLVFIIYAAYFAMLLISIYAIRVCTQKKYLNLVRMKPQPNLFLLINFYFVQERILQSRIKCPIYGNNLAMKYPKERKYGSNSDETETRSPSASDIENRGIGKNQIR